MTSVSVAIASDMVYCLPLASSHNRLLHAPLDGAGSSPCSSQKVTVATRQSDPAPILPQHSFMVTHRLILQDGSRGWPHETHHTLKDQLGMCGPWA